MIQAIQKYLENLPDSNLKIVGFKILNRESLKSDERYHIKSSGNAYEVIFDDNGLEFNCIFFEKLSIQEQMEICKENKT